MRVENAEVREVVADLVKFAAFALDPVEKAVNVASAGKLKLLALGG